MQILYILLYILIAFIGFATGRITHIYWGYTKSPHHWIYGLILMILGLIFYKILFGVIVFCFGLGHFISDLDDFLHLRFYGEDKEGEKRFWAID